MKALFICLILTCIFSSCCKHDETLATVVCDCTGTYLRISSQDYHVCNLEKVNSFADGASVKVSYTKISVCTGSANEDIVCQMVHGNEGWITVNSIQ